MYNNLNKLIAIKLKHTLIRNSLFGSGGFVFISLVGLIITPFLVTNFGLEQYGIYILITSIFGYYGIFSFGLGQGLIKFVSEFKSKNLDREVNDAVNSVFLTHLIIGFILSCCIYQFSDKIIFLFNVSTTFFEDAVISLQVAALGFFFSMLASTYSSALRGLELYGGVTVIDSISNLALNLLLLIVLMFNYGIKEAVWVNVFIAFIQLFTYSILFKKNLKSYYFRIRFNVKIITKFLSFTLYLFLSRISNIFATYVVRFVISFFLGPSAVTFYVVPAKLLGAIGGVLSSAANAIFPYTSRLAALGQQDEIKRSFLKSNLIFAGISFPILMVVSLFAKPIMTFWMGTDFAEESWIILSIISLSGIIGSLTTIPNLVLLGLGNSKLIGIFSGITIASYITFLPLLTQQFGLVGASVALLITSFIVIGFVMTKTTQVIGLKLSQFVNKVYRIHFIPIITFIFAYLFVRMFLPEGNTIQLAFGMGLCAFYYLYLFKQKVLFV